MDGLQIQHEYRPDVDVVAAVDAYWELVAAARSWWALEAGGNPPHTGSAAASHANVQEQSEDESEVRVSQARPRRV